MQIHLIGKNNKVMEITLEEKLNAIFNSGMFIVFKNEVKRNDGEWHNRIVWRRVEKPGDSTIKDCDWWGFDTIEEAADDCLDYIVIQEL